MSAGLTTSVNKGVYLKWVQDTPGAVNKLPKHVAKLKADAQSVGHQTSMTDHYKPAEPTERVTPYSDDLFKQAALEWLVQTDQVSRLHISLRPML